MKKIFFLVLLICSCLAISCEQGEEIVSPESDSPTKVTDASDSLLPTRSSSPQIRRFYLNIEGGDYAVGIINRLKNPEERILITKDMCPYYYESYLPSYEYDHYIPKDDDIEIIAVNASMRYILGFRDEYGAYSHDGTYHYGALWNDSESITAIFDPESWWPDPLPVGFEGYGPAGGSSTLPSLVDVDIQMEREGSVYDIEVMYTDRFNNMHTQMIGRNTRLYYVNANCTLTLRIHNTSFYTGILMFDAGMGSREVRISGGMTETVDYSLNNISGTFSLRIS